MIRKKGVARGDPGGPAPPNRNIVTSFLAQKNQLWRHFSDVIAIMSP